MTHTTEYDAVLRERPDIARTYRCLAALPADHWDALDTAAACNLAPGQAQQHLEYLLEHNLLQEHGAHGAARYAFHDVVRDHARQTARECDPASDRDETVRRYLDWMLTAATESDRIATHAHYAHHRVRSYVYVPSVAPPFTTEADAVAWLEVQQENVFAAIAVAVDSGDDAMVWQLVYALWPLWHRLRPWEQMIDAHQAALAAVRRCQDTTAELIIHSTLGFGLRSVDRYDEAIECYESVVALAREVDDLRMEAQALSGLGSAHHAAGDLTQARACARRSLELRESIGHRRGAALSRVHLARVELEESRPMEALPLLVQARVELLAEEDRFDAPRCLDWLGRAWAALGDPVTGDLLLAQAMTEFEAINQKHWYAFAAEMRGEIALEQGDRLAARAFFETSRATYEPISPGDTHRLEERLNSVTAER